MCQSPTLLGGGNHFEMKLNGRFQDIGVTMCPRRGFQNHDFCFFHYLLDSLVLPQSSTKQAAPLYVQVFTYCNHRHPNQNRMLAFPLEILIAFKQHYRRRQLWSIGASRNPVAVSLYSGCTPPWSRKVLSLIMEFFMRAVSCKSCVTTSQGDCQIGQLISFLFLF